VTDDGAVRSRWWYGVAASLLLLAGAWGSWLVLRATSTPTGGDPATLAPTGGGSLFLLSLLATVLFVVGTWLSVPVLSASLYADARRLAGGDGEWTPDPRVYGGVGVVHLAALAVPYVYALTVPASLWYLFQRHRHVGAP